MASMARLYPPLLQMRSIGSANLKPKQVLVRKSRPQWTKHLLTFGVPFIAGLIYSQWSRGGQILTIEHPGKPTKHEDRGSDSGDDGTTHGWKAFIRCTQPRKHFYDPKTLSTAEKEKLENIRRIFTNKEKKDRVYEDLLNRVNSRLAKMMFLGVGFPNSVSIVMADVPEVIRFYGYEAQGLEFRPDGVRWTTSDVHPRAASKVDNILAAPRLAYHALKAVILSEWTPAKSHVIPSASQTGPQTRHGITRSEPHSKSTPTVDSNDAETLTASTRDTRVSQAGGTGAKALASDTGSASSDAQSKSKPFYSHDNHVDVITSFLGQQKDAVRQSTGGPAGTTRKLLDNFWREFNHQRAIRMFETHDPPGGNVVFTVTVVVRGQRRRLVLLVEGDYDATNDTWGPIFIEPAISMRSHARRRNRNQ